jgi:hypothetical protein
MLMTASTPFVNAGRVWPMIVAAAPSWITTCVPRVRTGWAQVLPPDIEISFVKLTCTFTVASP